MTPPEQLLLINECIKGAEHEILMTPTGARRKELTLSNIYLHKAKESLEKVTQEDKDDKFREDCKRMGDANEGAAEELVHKELNEDDEEGYCMCGTGCAWSREAEEEQEEKDYDDLP